MIPNVSEEETFRKFFEIDSKSVNFEDIDDNEENHFENKREPFSAKVYQWGRLLLIFLLRI